MHARNVALLLLSAVMLLLTAAPASAQEAAKTASDIPAKLRPLTDECLDRDHPGQLTSRHTVRDLRSLLRVVEKAKLKYSRCWTAAASQLSGFQGPAGRSSQLIDDCVRHRARLTRRYAVAVLRRALKNATPEIRDETHCLPAIASQLNGRKKRSQRPVIAPARRAPDAVRDADRIIGLHSIFRRSWTEADVPPAGPFEAIPDEFGTTIETTRQVGGLKGMRLFVSPANVGVCYLMDFAPSGGGFTNVCAGVGALSGGFAHVPGGVMVASLIPDGTTNVRVVDYWGKWRRAPLTDGVLARVYQRLPRMVTAVASDGRTHYRDLNHLW